MLSKLHSDTNSLKFGLFHLTGRLIVDQEKLGLFIVTDENVCKNETNRLPYSQVRSDIFIRSIPNLIQNFFSCKLSFYSGKHLQPSLMGRFLALSQRLNVSTDVSRNQRHKLTVQKSFIRSANCE
jgi:hypothetical protein